MSHYVNLLTYLLLSCLITSILSFRNPHQRSNLLPHINQIDKNNPIDFNYDQLIEKVKKNIPSGSTIVIKYGGHAMENQDLKESFCKDIGTLCGLGIIPIIVHGGGPQIQKMLTRLGIESKFINGLRVTDSQTIEIAQMILCGSINKEIVSMISKQPNTRGAIGLSGLDSGIIKAKKIEKYDINPITNEKFKIDLGLVGEPYEINTSILNDFRKLKLVPVIAPIGCDDDGNSLNINADTSAGAVAESLKVCHNDKYEIYYCINPFKFFRLIDYCFLLTLLVF